MMLFSVGDEPAPPNSGRQIRRGFRMPRLLKWAVALGAFIGLVVHEADTSAIQSWIFSHWNRHLSYALKPGPSARIVFPKHGPFDRQAGYIQIPEFGKLLEAHGYQVLAQTRFSRDLALAANFGISPPYEEPASTGLTIRDMSGQSIFQGSSGNELFRRFNDIPPPVVKALLLIEDRELDEPTGHRMNPAINWDRFAKATLLYAGHLLGLPVPIEGGSTLATQMEKYRHSIGGRTNSVFAKLRQMISASLKAYRRGPDTRAERRRLVVDYLNTVPLAATPRQGSVYGLGAALQRWFGLNLYDVCRLLRSTKSDPAKVEAFKDVLDLLCSVRGPTYYLVENRAALNVRVDYYIGLLVRTGVIDRGFARQLRRTPAGFLPQTHIDDSEPLPEAKAADVVRTELLSVLGLPGFYSLDQLQLSVDSTIDTALQRETEQIFASLKDPDFLSAHGLRGEQLLSQGNPKKVIYGLILFERLSNGYALRVDTDTLDAPFDLNRGMKLQLGSTAKLRTLANYLAIAASLYRKLSPLDSLSLRQQLNKARDPITRWAAGTLVHEKRCDLDAFLQEALDRRYSASPGEFFTDGGVHFFHNFENDDNGRTLTVREATIRSVNLVYVRLMRDLIRYYEARLSYNTQKVLGNSDPRTRHRLLVQIADSETKYFLHQAYGDFQGRSRPEILESLLGKKIRSSRNLAVLFYAWGEGHSPGMLARWLRLWGPACTQREVQKLMHAYGNSRLTLPDYAYLLGIQPLKLWCAGELIRQPSLSWAALWHKSVAARRIASEWLFKTRNRHAQDMRLRTRFEQDAFVSMTRYWRRLGFPFKRLDPSLATALGSSGDRPEALAELMGIILDNGMREPFRDITSLRFANGTPYETIFGPNPQQGKRVMDPAVARAIRPVLAGVVAEGTAKWVQGAFTLPNGVQVVAGGKTGSGDNRFDRFAPGGKIVSSRPVNRTATFAFYLGDRYVGVLTAFVPGKAAGDYRFTSALPVSILKLLAPSLDSRLAESTGQYNRLVSEPKEPGATGDSPAPVPPTLRSSRNFAPSVLQQ